MAAMTFVELVPWEWVESLYTLVVYNARQLDSGHIALYRNIAEFLSGLLHEDLKLCLHCIGFSFIRETLWPSFRPALLCLCLFLYVLQTSFERALEQVFCMLDDILNHELNPKLLRLVFLLQWQRCKNISGTTHTTWKSGAPHRRFDAEIDTIILFHIYSQTISSMVLRRYASYPIKCKHKFFYAVAPD
jgi:hypothetical protein